MMKKKYLKIISGVLSIVLIVILLVECGKTQKIDNDPVVSSEVGTENEEGAEAEAETKAETEAGTETVVKLDENAIQDLYTGIDNLYVLKDAVDVNYLHGVLYDDAVVAEITVDDSQVDTSKEGSYKLIFNIVINRLEYDEYVNAPSLTGEEKADPKNKETVKVEKEVTVVNKEEATKLADEDKIVLAGKDNTVSKTDGTKMEKEEKAPASTEKTNGSSVDSKGDTKKPTVTEKPTPKPDKPDTTTKPDDTDNDNKPSKPDTTTKPDNTDNDNKPSKPDTTTKPDDTDNDNKPSKPDTTTKPDEPEKPEHVHSYTIPIYKEIQHPAVTHEEPVYEKQKVVTKEAWTEKREIVGQKCSQCGFWTSSVDEMAIHMLENGHSCHTHCKYEYIEHPAVTEMKDVQVGTKTIVDKEAWTEKKIIGYKCECGATK